jgi:hypothetical protein
LPYESGTWKFPWQLNKGITEALLLRAY